MVSKAERERRRKMMKEKITFGVKGKEDSFVHIPRYRLKPKAINQIFGIIVDFVQDEAGGVVYANDFMWHCMPPPYKYFVREKEVFHKPIDQGLDPTYDGSTVIVLWKVPVRIGADHLSIWLKKGLEKMDDGLVEATGHVQELEELIEENKTRIDNVPYMNTISTTDKGMADERRIMLKQLEKDGKDLKAKLDRALDELEEEQQRRLESKMYFRQVEVQEKLKCATWHVVCSKPEDADNIIALDGWQTLRLTVGPNAMATFDEKGIPEEEIENEVVMRAVVVERMRHGLIGVHTDWIRGQAYRGPFYHGMRHHILETETDERKGLEYEESFGKKKNTDNKRRQDMEMATLHDRLGRFDGFFRFDRRHGHGKQEYGNGDVYEGEFGYNPIPPEDRGESQAIPKLPKLSTYSFAQGVPNGFGKMTFADSSYYEGEFWNGRVTGRGKYYNPSTGETKEGTFVNGLLHGDDCTHTTPFGEQFSGSFEMGQLHGVYGVWKGKMTSKNASALERKGELHDCDVLEGSWEQGQCHGKGKYTWKRGEQYDGFYRDGLRSGPGTYIYGNVEEKFDKLTGSTQMLHDFAYEGVWLAGKIRARNNHITVMGRQLQTEKLQKTTRGYADEKRDLIEFTTNFKSWSKYLHLHTMVHKEERKRQRRFNRELKWREKQSAALRAQSQEIYASFKQNRKDRIALYKEIDTRLGKILDEWARKNGDYIESSEEEEIPVNSGGEDEEDDDEDDEEDEEDGEAYYDSDWESDVGNVNFKDTGRDSEYQAMVNNPVCRALHVSLLDVIENPPTQNNRKGFGSNPVKMALEHYLYTKANGTAN